MCGFFIFIPIYPADIRDSIIHFDNGAICPRLVKLTMTSNSEIQCNSAGALGNLATQRQC